MSRFRRTKHHGAGVVDDDIDAAVFRHDPGRQCTAAVVFDRPDSASAGAASPV